MAQPSSSSVDRRRGFRAFALASVSLGFGLLVLAMPTARATQPSPAHEVTLCHATSSDENPYVEVTVDIASVKFLGHHSHNGDGPGIWYAEHPGHWDWGDIVPAFTIGNLAYPGKNVPAGSAILGNGCDIPVVTTTSSVEETTTSSSSTSTTVEETTTSSSTSTTVEETTTSSSTSTTEAPSTTVEDASTTVEDTSTTGTTPTTVLAEFLTAPDDLPKTGDDAMPMAAAGVAFIALGGAVLVLQRRLQVS